MNFQESLAVLRSRWKTVVASIATAVLFAILISVVVNKHYKATVTVVADLSSGGPLDPNAVPGQLLQNYTGTQIDIINSDRVARKVVDRLHLDKWSYLVDKWKADSYYRPDNFVSWAAEWLKKRLSITQPRDSDVIEIKFSSIYPQFSADAANAFAETYVATVLELNTEPAKNSLSWFESLSTKLRADLANAQNALSAFQKANDIVATDDRLDVETARLNELEQQVVTAEGQSAESSSRAYETKASVESLPEVLQDRVVQNIRTQIVQTQAQMDDLAGRLGTSHPEYVSVKTQLKSLQEREAAEIQRVVGSIGNTNRVSAGRARELRLGVADQKARVLQFRAQHDQAAVLQRDVDTAQHAYDLVSQRLAKLALEGQLQQTNVAVLSRAFPPYKESWPKLPLDMLVAVLFGGLLGAGIAFLREHMDERVHSADQLRRLAGVPTTVIDISRARAANDDVPRLSRAKAWLLSRAS